MLRSRKLKFFVPGYWENKDDCRSRRRPQLPGMGGGCMAASGEDISMVAVGGLAAGLFEGACSCWRSYENEGAVAPTRRRQDGTGLGGGAVDKHTATRKLIRI